MRMILIRIPAQMRMILIRICSAARRRSAKVVSIQITRQRASARVVSLKIMFTF